MLRYRKHGALKCACTFKYRYALPVNNQETIVGQLLFHLEF